MRILSVKRPADVAKVVADAKSDMACREAGRREADVHGLVAA